ncbi:MAG: rod shape-determining protein RodA [Treponema sp.]|jgi:rod shape determining protein RodA|nr:rod shape-determining protein RodA [Treponema sp.]
MKPKELLRIDYSLLLAAMVLTTLGILLIYSSGINAEGELVSGEYIRQIVWASVGFVLIVFLAALDYWRLFGLSAYLYAGILLLLLYTAFFGRYVGGARRGIGVGIFSVQPAEFAKIITILFLARYLELTKRERNSLGPFILSCLIVLAPMGIILLQPDLGTALVFIPILLTMIFIAGFSTRYILFLVLLIAAAVLVTMLPYWEQYILKNPRPLLTLFFNSRFIGLCSLVLLGVFLIAFMGHRLYKKIYFYWICYVILILLLALDVSFAAHKILKEYQVMRLIIFLDPGIDSRGAGWNIIQSMTAIGSGDLLGKGYLQGTHSHYRFLPEQSTDFIFSIFGEEFGFLGGLVIFGLFLLIFLRLTVIMKSTADSFGTYIVAGLAAVFIFHFVINVGMTMGVMPITGIPLYFMSYGGSALLTGMAGIGLAMSVFVRRFRR